MVLFDQLMTGDVPAFNHIYVHLSGHEDLCLYWWRGSAWRLDYFNSLDKRKRSMQSYSTFAAGFEEFSERIRERVKG